MAGREPTKPTTKPKTVKAKPGPKLKLTDAKRIELLKALSEGMPLSFSCDLIGISRPTIYRMIESNPDLKTQIDVAKAVAIRGLVAATEKQSGAWKLLKNLGREEFKEHVEIEQKSDITLVVETDDGDEEFDF